MKRSYFIIFIALLIAFTSVAAAAEVDDTDMTNDVSTSVAPTDVAQSVDTPITVSDNSNENKIIKNTLQTTENVAVKENSGQTRNTTPNVWNLNNTNFDEYITESGLNTIINDSDILNFTENIYRTSTNYTVDKPVNINGNGFTLDLNTIYGYNLPSLDPTWIEFNNGASNSNITNLKFHNTQVFTTTASNITFDNINVTVENQGVGKGTGYFAMRDGVINITVKNSYFYAVNNTGCSAIVITLGENCTIDNNTVMGSGKVGNLIYLNMYGATNNANNITKNRANKITNNIISCTDGENICWGITVTGPRNVIENNSISITEGQYGITTTWSGSYDNETDPEDTHNVTYYGNTYRNNTVNGKFSTGNYSIVENNTINGASTINGHANVTNNTFLGAITVHNNVRFHSNNATGQTITVQKPNSCFKDNVIGTLSLESKSRYTYNCGGNTIGSIPKNTNNFKTCNGDCPNCNPNIRILSKKSINLVKTESSEILYSDDTCTIYNNGTAIIKITQDNQRYLTGGLSNSHINENSVTDLILYINSINYNSWDYYIEEFDIDLGNNKNNINLKIVWNMSGNTLRHGFKFSDLGYNSVTYENCKFYIKTNEEDSINHWGFYSNLNFINCTFNFRTDESFGANSWSFYNTELWYKTEGGWYTDPGATENIMSIVGENILFEKCNFDLQTVLPWIDEEYPEDTAYTNIIVFNNSNNVTFNNNSFTITTQESDSDIPVTDYGPFLNRTVNNLTFINNDVVVSYVRGIMLKTNNSLFENNTISLRHTDKTIELTGDNNIVRYNTLTAGENEGDATVTVTGTGNIVKQNPYVEPVLPKTIIVTQDNVDEVFGGENHTLYDDVNPGDILDFQGLIDKEHSLVINKPVNVISSTQDAVISLHTVAGSLMGEDPGNSFVINIGASGSNISGLYLQNTECWVHNLYNARLYNMTMHVEDARVGSGVGQTSLRYCNNVTMDSCHIYTKNNGGSSSFVWTGCNNCTIINSTIQGEGQVGNLLYVGNQFNTQDKPANYTITNFDNNVINCTVLGGTGGISNPLQNAAIRTLIQGNKFYSGGSASAGTNGTMIDNEFYRTVSVSMTANCIAYGNVHYGTGSATVQANAQVYNNTFNAVTISGKDALFEDNIVKGKLTISQPVNAQNNNLTDVQVNTNGKTSNITHNNVTGTITSAAADVTVDSNIINTTNDYTVVVTGATNRVTNNVLYTAVKAGDATLNVKADTIVENNTPESGAEFEITDENYSQFFDTNGVLSNINVTDYSSLTFKGTFNDKVFKFDNIILSITGEDAVINNGFISTDNNAKISLENVVFNNTNEGIENSIVLNTDGNLVRNVEVYRTSTSGISREIMVNGDKNTIVSNKFDLEVPVENIDYSEYPFAISNVSAITITGSDNNVSSNTITVRNTTAGVGTISVIDLASRTKNSGNTVNSNTINAESSGYLYGINLGANTDTNTINSNKITLNSDYYTAGIQVGYAPAENNIINSNTINLTSPVAYGVLASAYGGIVSGTTINSNNIYITANESAGIELCGSTPDLITGATITSNKIIVDGNYSIGIAVAGSNINIVTNTLTVKGTTNSSDESSYDIIKPTTAGIVIKDSLNVQAYNNTMDVVNGANIILNGTNDSKIVSTLSTASRYINAENNANMVLSNSNNNVIDTQKAYTNNVYCIELKNSSNNNITNNNLNASNLKGGNSAVSMDESSVDNYLFNNIPEFGLLTDETYSTLFDENGRYKFPEGIGILTLAGDLHGKDLIFTNNVTFVNADNFTIYNGTVILSDLEDANYTDRFVTFKNINVNNTDKAAFIDNLSVYKQRNIQFYGGHFTVTGDNITAFESVHEIPTYSILDVYDAVITMAGKDVAAFRMIRDSYSRYDYLDVERCNISLKATGKNRAFEVINTNLDILTNNIIQEGSEVSTLYATDVYANGQFFMNNNINVTGDNIAIITLKDNYGSNPTFGNNTILAASTNPVSVMNISNATNVYVGQGQYNYASYNKPNTIIVDAENGEVPLIYIESNGYVRNNFIMSNDLYGVEAVYAATKSNITPTRTSVTITAPEEAKVFEEITITATVANATNTADGTIILTINDEEVTRATGNTITYTTTPTTNETLNIAVQYNNETTKFVSSNASATITVNKAGTILSLDTNRPFLDENLTINITLTNENKAIANTELTLTINTETITVTTDSEGKYNYITTPIEGNNTITVSFDGGNVYESAEQTKSFIVIDLEKYALIDELNKTVEELNNTIQELNNTINELNNTIQQQTETINELNNTTQELNNTIQQQTETINELNNTIQQQTETIKDIQETLDQLNNIITEMTTTKDTILTLDPIENVKYNSKVTITGKLTDIDENALKYSYIIITINGIDTAVRTNNKGVYSYTTTLNNMAIKEITALYEGDNKYNPSEANITITMEKADCIITIDEITDKKYNDELVITGTFTDSKGTPLINSAVTITINDKINYAKTDNNGVYTLTTKANTIGQNNITAGYRGNRKYNAYTTDTITFNVEKADCIITVDTIPDATYKDTITITGTFKTATGTALKNSQINIYINGVKHTAITDDNGIYTYTIKATIIGTNNITAEYAGNAKYNTYTTDTITFNIAKKDTIITMDTVTVDNGLLTVTGKFTDNDGTALKNSNVIVYVNGAHHTVKTDDTGAYTYTSKVTDTVTVNVSYLGNLRYNAYTSPSITMTTA